MAETLRKTALSAELAAARDRMGGHTVGLRRSLSPSENIKRGVHQNPAAWFGGAVLLGLLLSRIPARRKEVKVQNLRKGDRKEAVDKAGKAAVAVTILKFALDLAKPTLTRLAREKLASISTGRRSAFPGPRAPVPMGGVGPEGV